MLQPHMVTASSRHNSLQLLKNRFMVCIMASIHLETKNSLLLSSIVMQKWYH